MYDRVIAMDIAMPTELPPRRLIVPERDNAGLRDIVIISTIALSGLCLFCELWFGPTLGYSLASGPDHIQLSP